MGHSEEESPTTQARLANDLTDTLLDMGAIRSTAVEAAFRNVPRHLFLPDAPLEQVYSDSAVTTKRASDGQPLSSSTQPSIMAGMLEQLQLDAGHRVLEIGAGTGYNAALMAHIVGPGGHVVTLDVDDDIVMDAQRHLAAAGHNAVQIIRRDGTAGYPEAAPYDRIILTVGAHDIAPAWREQLASGGRIVLPLVLRARQRSIAFHEQNGVLTSSSIRSGIVFIPLRDTVGASRNVVPIMDDNSIIVEVADVERIDAQEIAKLLDRPGVAIPAGMPAAALEELAGLATWLELHDPDFCHFSGQDLASDDRRFPTLLNEEGFRSTFGIYSNDTLALLRHSRPEGLENRKYSPHDIEILCLGQDETVAQRLQEVVAAWDQAGRPDDSNLRIRVFPANTPHDHTTSGQGLTLQKRWTQLVCDWRG